MEFRGIEERVMFVMEGTCNFVVVEALRSFSNQNRQPPSR